jgi:hypothetical protein
MIAKHVPMRALKRSDYAGLLQYLLDPQNKNERVGTVRVTYCQSIDPDVATIEVLNTQSLNRRATGDKTYHLILSFHAGEQPDQAVLRALEERVCAALGYADHQRISVVHHDTDNLHVHIAINKIHPTRHTILSPYNDHLTLGKVCQQLEHEFDLQRDNHAARKHGPESRAGDMEHHAGVESLLGWIKRECWSEMQGSASWDGLQKVMAEYGLRLHERGNGLVITTSDGGTTVKASSVDRQFSKARLEERLGPFQHAPDVGQAARPAKRYERKPFRFNADTSTLFVRYEAQRNQGESREQEWARARERKNGRVAAAKSKAKLKRSVIKLLSCDRLSKRILFAAVGRSLKSEIERANREYFRERERIYLKHIRVTWADWLHAEAMHGNEEALSALRSREGAGAHAGNTLTGRRRAKSPRPGVIDGITKHGTIIICTGTTVLRDDGGKLTVTKGYDQAGLQAALRLAAERYGSCLRVEGSKEFREQIARAAASARLSVTFDNAALEARRIELVQAAINKETSNEHKPQPRQGRPADSSVQAAGPGRADTGVGIVATGHAADGRKPNVGAVGKKPPPESKDRLRRLSQLGVVRIPGGGEVLLPGDVPGHMEQQGPAADHRVRRTVSGTGRITRKEGRAKADAASTTGRPQAKAARSSSGRAPPPAGRNHLRKLRDVNDASSATATPPSGNVDRFQAMDRGKNGVPASASVAQHEIPALKAVKKYVFEREQKRLTLSDIPKHLAYDGFQGQAAFAGLRTIDDQALALLKRGNEIVVVAVDDATALRLKRLARGETVMVAGQGAIRKKGRSR